ncbi:ParB N-terminal domain-containing protein [Spirillospora sp. NPDC047279]|uniref:ParB N-terminal domain-containing protein n=1 Tax=Spirillospora sp. NPDC047279 TaxID=3155478 RepID=UPI0033EB3E4B
MRSAPSHDDLHPAEEVDVSSLAVGGSPRLAGESRGHIEMMAASETRLPPIIVHRPTMRVIDGMHRLQAARLRGQTTISVRFFDGAEDDAFVLAVTSNIAHGLPLSLADRKRATGRIIATHPVWSDRMIASVVGISAKTVADIRRSAGGDATARTARIGRDGRIRSIDVSAGRKRAHELIVQDPSLSLRQVARAAGISPETVRDVKNRLLRGEGPLPRGRSRALVGGRRAGAPAARRDAQPGGPPSRRAPGPPPASVVERLRADPALRLNEHGRNLLRLLNIHTIQGDDWNRIIDSVPPHRMHMVAQLARVCADKWAELALRMEREFSQENHF